jgi:hypothetical protein
MHDPRPVTCLLLLQLLASLLLTAWWCSLSTGQRFEHLRTVATAEQVAPGPPATLLGQVEWLSTHRLTQLQGMVGLVAVGGLVGAGEGVTRRRQDPLGGFLWRWWTGAVLLAALLPGSVGAYLLAPWPVPSVWMACGLTGMLGCIGYGLFSGRPFIP